MGWPESSQSLASYVPVLAQVFPEEQTEAGLDVQRFIRQMSLCNTGEGSGRLGEPSGLKAGLTHVRERWGRIEGWVGGWKGLDCSAGLRKVSKANGLTEPKPPFRAAPRLPGRP